jgi:CheY-like chemotaxis protein
LKNPLRSPDGDAFISERELSRVHKPIALVQSDEIANVVQLLNSTTSGSSSGGESSADRAKRVLVVEDHRDSAEMLCEVLQAYGCVTRVAHDGMPALEAAQSFKPDIALVDISLPQMDGYEVARRIRQLPGLGEIKLIALTGHGEAAHRSQSAQAGFDRHLVKPVDPEELRRLIKD